MFSVVVVLDEGEVVESGFDVQDEAEFVVELERDRPHGVLDVRPFEADVQAVAHLSLIAGIEPFFIRALPTVGDISASCMGWPNEDAMSRSKDRFVI